jgi:hypothetical protein
MERQAPFVITGTTGTIAHTWVVVRYSVPGENGAPPTIMHIIATTWKDVLLMNEASTNSEWTRLMSMDRPVIVEVIHVGLKADCVMMANRLAISTGTHCMKHGVRMNHRTSNIRCSNGVTYQTQSEAAAALGISQPALSAHLAGKLAHVKGFVFTRVYDPTAPVRD